MKVIALVDIDNNTKMSYSVLWFTVDLYPNRTFGLEYSYKNEYDCLILKIKNPKFTKAETNEVAHLNKNFEKIFKEIKHLRKSNELILLKSVYFPHPF